MKRDIDLIRLILMETESGEDCGDVKKYPEKQIVYHIALMKDAGLLVAHISEDERGDPCGALVTRLTWTGHDFLDSVRDNTIWNKAKEKVIKPTASWTFSILSEWLKQEIRSRIPGLSDIAT